MIDFAVDTDILLRLGAALICGGAIGLNRNMQGKPTGFRAHSLVALGSAILMIAGSMSYTGHGDPGDASRVIQGIVAGIGFLGAGVILRSADGDRVFHLTTAASLWITTGVGILCGIGAFQIAFIGTGLVLFVLVAGLYLDKWLHIKSGIKRDDLDC